MAVPTSAGWLYRDQQLFESDLGRSRRETGGLVGRYSAELRVGLCSTLLMTMEPPFGKGFVFFSKAKPEGKCSSVSLFMPSKNVDERVVTNLHWL